jgi:hypothetical protein
MVEGTTMHLMPHRAPADEVIGDFGRTPRFRLATSGETEPQ